MDPKYPGGWHIRLFGRLTVRAPSGYYLSIKHIKSQWLLGILSVNNGKPIERDYLAACLWPEFEGDENALKSNLRTTLSRLKSDLNRVPWLKSPDSNHLQVDLTAAECDMAALDALLRHDPSAVDQEELEHALLRCRGNLLEQGPSDPLLDTLRFEWVEKRFVELRRLALNHFSRPKPDYLAAARCAQAALDLEFKDDTQLYEIWMEAEANRKSLPGLHRAFAYYKNHSSDSFDTTECVFKRLNERLKASGAGVPGKEAARGPRLLAEPGKIIGRDRDLERLLALFEDSRGGGHRLVTVNGAPGIGKSRFALAAAHRLKGRFREGTSYISLSGIQPGPPEAEYAAIEVKVGMVIGIDSREADTIGFLSEAEMLIVLDGCENVGAGIEDFLVRLLGECPGVSVLAVSRNALPVIDARAFRLDGLGLPDLAEMVGSGWYEESVRTRA